jgi:hypothetical protein
MTYDDIITALQRGKCIETIAALERAIEAERDELHKLHPLRDGGKLALSRAKGFYAEDITSQLAEPAEPTPSRMLRLRRFPVAWAVAEVLRTNGLVVQS